MKAIHPFPARMAPDTICKLLEGLPRGAVILDPMCGSGVVVRRATEMGLRGIGFDIDPLAVLMSRVWTSKKSGAEAISAASHITTQAKLLRLANVRLPWIDRCQETQQFLKYWFASPQRRQLRKLSFLITYRTPDLPPQVRECLWLALSRIIITKHAGASLSWDAPHSRPHRVRDDNDFDVLSNFLRSTSRLVEILEQDPLKRSGKIRSGDCRNLASVHSHSIDVVITSPPYLNAIDYLRGHKLSLVWMGHSIPSLRDIRSSGIGTEAARIGANSLVDVEPAIRSVPNTSLLPTRQRNILRRYATDASIFLTEMHRVLTPGGRLSLVLGDSNVRGHHIANSRLFAQLAKRIGFKKTSQRRRALQENRRYLPVTSNNNTLENRMRYEVIQTYVATS